MAIATAIGATDGVDAMVAMLAIIGLTTMTARASISALADIGTITATIGIGAKARHGGAASKGGAPSYADRSPRTRSRLWVNEMAGGMCSNRQIRTTMRLALLSLAVLVFRTPGAVAASPSPLDLQENVIALALERSQTVYQEPTRATWPARISYNEYFGIRVKPGKEIWTGEQLGFEVHPMALGPLFDRTVELSVVESGRVTRVTSEGRYEHSLPAMNVPDNGDLGISGFRITAPLNNASKMDEVAVFQGGSYFRAVSRGQVYGLSARGLSLNAGNSEPEEFPWFRQFWIEKPNSSREIVIHALLDSPSVTGAYRIALRPGAPTEIDVAAKLFPRRDLSDIGMAPLSSMYFYSLADSKPITDFRPQVHDSDGLAFIEADSAHNWRPLANPPAVRTTRFSSIAPRGFGLMQRERRFLLFQDLEARYHDRPSAWIEPTSNWGAGTIELIEIPTKSEVHDNIVAQWKPSLPLRKGERFDISYRISWPDEVRPNTGARAVRTLLAEEPDGRSRIVVDFAPARGPELPRVAVTTSAGAVTDVTVQSNAPIEGVRVSFLFDPLGSSSADLRLKFDEVGDERWLYRWTRRAQVEAEALPQPTDDVR